MVPFSVALAVSATEMPRMGTCAPQFKNKFTRSHRAGEMVRASARDWRDRPGLDLFRMPGVNAEVHMTEGQGRRRESRLEVSERLARSQ